MTRQQLASREKELSRIRKEKAEVAAMLQAEREKMNTLSFDMKKTATICSTVKDAIAALEKKLADGTKHFQYIRLKRSQRTEMPSL